MTDLSTPTLAGLAYALRRPELWPAGFVWDGAHPHKNAVGLAFKLWNGPRSYDDSTDGYKFELSKILNCTDIEPLLCSHLPIGGGHRQHEPEDIAARVERKLRQARSGAGSI